MDCCKTRDESGCCKKLEESSFFGSKDEKMKGGKRRMNSRIVLWMIVGALFIIALFLTFKAGAVGSAEVVQATGSVAKTATSNGGMVGGC
jgi:predicted nucleic acid-binding Zn ribbon protein